uniref:RNA helicase n=1 Tax=Aceria tosichella TaxID=561515 RepID=A0A6G1SP84_9ACAR
MRGQLEPSTLEELPVVSFEMDQEAEDTEQKDGKKTKKNKNKEKSTKPKKPGGTFASMGLSRPVLKAIDRKGYKLATPIQRKCIPPIMLGKDLVAMARTGSGKSAAFLLPIIDRLKIRQPKAEIRALIISPTRELALQTLKFVRDFTKFTNLSSKMIIGGESINRDFETITSSPDILVATPGRLAHVLVEMKKKLDGLEVVVFDEADRLFEPGFKEMEQVNEICSRLNDSKQTLLFSATMPQRLAEFAKAGLKEPEFIRLDVEANLSENLKSIHLHCNHQDKFAVLLHLLKHFSNKDQMLVVFMPTRHHIEYAKSLLENTRLKCCYVYSSMDPEARRINIDKFTKKHCRVMLVTDIAARGIDIPLLDIVINFNFPFKPKLYIHRVGRVARAGRFGCAISLLSHDETPYLHALQMFLDQPLLTALEVSSQNGDQLTSLESLPDKVLGSVPQDIIDDENDILNRWHEHNEELKAMLKVCDNAMKPYLKTREPPAPLSVQAAKDVHRRVIGVHPLFSVISEVPVESTTSSKTSAQQQSIDSNDSANMLDRIRSYKPKDTIFEVGHIKGNMRTEAFGVMQKKRQVHDKIAQKRGKASNGSDSEGENDEDHDHEQNQSKSMPVSCKPIEPFEDKKFYLKYRPDDYAKEKGLELDKGVSFNNDLKRATFDLVADDENQMKRQRHQMIWDRKKKKYVSSSGLDEKKPKKIKTESGALISASYSSGLYEKWRNQSKVDQRVSDDEDDNDDNNETQKNRKGFNGGRRNKSKQPGRLSIEKLRSKLKPTKRRWELKNPDEMLKERGIKEKREAILRIKTMKKAQRRKV